MSPFDCAKSPKFEVMGCFTNRGAAIRKAECEVDTFCGQCYHSTADSISNYYTETTIRWGSNTLHGMKKVVVRIDGPKIGFHDFQWSYVEDGNVVKEDGKKCFGSLGTVEDGSDTSIAHGTAPDSVKKNDKEIPILNTRFQEVSLSGNTTKGKREPASGTKKHVQKWFWR